jgi:hypothetical protein
VRSRGAAASPPASRGGRRQDVGAGASPLASHGGRPGHRPWLQERGAVREGGEEDEGESGTHTNQCCSNIVGQMIYKNVLYPRCKTL